MEFVRSTRSHSSDGQTITVTYVTDIEGNWDYWDRFVRLSGVLKLTETNESGIITREITLKENCHLVFGGDVCDRGPGDIRVVRELLGLKNDFPENVHFILGNRDVNKLRLAVELDPCILATAGKVYWVDATSGGEADVASGAQNSVDRLKWILKATMGSPGAFEFRRAELEVLGRPHEDIDVVNSYLEWVRPEQKDIGDPGGELYQFLCHGKIALIIGDTLYVHGALKPANIGWVPPNRGESPAGKVVEDLREWIKQINDFLQLEMTDYRDNFAVYMDILRRERAERMRSDAGSGGYYLQTWAVEGGYANLMPASRLLQYGIGFLPNLQENPSSLYACYLSKASPQFTAQQISNISEYTRKNFQNISRRPARNGTMLMKQMSANKSQGPASRNNFMDRPGHHKTLMKAAGTAIMAKNRMLSKSNSMRERQKPAASALPAMVAPRPPASASVDEVGMSAMKRCVTVGCEVDASQMVLSYSVDQYHSSSANLATVDEDSVEASLPTVRTNSSMSESEVSVSGVGENVRGGLFGTGEYSEADADSRMNEYILSHGIRRIVVGHQPRGDAPLILMRKDLQIISADTSYASNVEWVGKYEAPLVDESSESFSTILDRFGPPPVDSTRGITVFEILISQTGNDPSQVFIAGRLSNGIDYAFHVHDENDVDQYVGRQTPAGWYVKLCGVVAINTENVDSECHEFYLLSLLSGFSVKNRLVPKDSIHLEFVVV